MMTLRDLKRKAKKRPEIERAPSTVEKARYPYGLNIELENEELQKLGKSVSDFKVGDQIPVMSRATVTATRQNDDESGSRGGITLQLRKLALGK